MSIQLVKLPLFEKQDLIQSALEAIGDEDQIMVQTPAVMAETAEEASSNNPAEWDSPETRLIDQNARTLFLTKTQLLDENGDLKLTGSNEGGGKLWNAILYVPVSELSSEARELLKAKGAQIIDMPESGFVSINENQFDAALAQEGYQDAAAYNAEIEKVKLSDGLNAELEKRQRLIGLLHTALKEDSCLVKRNLALATILRQMIHIDNMAHQAELSGEDALAQKAKAALQQIKDDYGFHFEHDPQFIFARKSKGATLTLPQLGLVVKSPGDVPAHEVNDKKDIADIDLTKGGVLLTARHQMQRNLDTADQAKTAYAQTVGLDSEYSVLHGIEIQKFIPGDTLEEFMLQEAENFTPGDDLSGELRNKIGNIAASLVYNQLILESFGLEQTDWSASGFKVEDPTTMKLKPVDLGNVGAIPLGAISNTSRQAKIKNITGSFHSLNEHREFQEKVSSELSDAIDVILGTRSQMSALFDRVKQEYHS